MYCWEKWTEINLNWIELKITISSMNIKSGTNGILPCRTKRSITLDLQKQMIWFKKQQKEQLFRFDMVPNLYTYILNKDHIYNIFASDCTNFYTDCIYIYIYIYEPKFANID